MHGVSAVAVSAALAALNAGVHFALDAALGGAFAPEGASPMPFLVRNILSSIPIDLFVYTAIVGVASAFQGRRRAAELEGEAARLEAQLAMPQLQALRMQLNPHFLFNALQTVSALTGPDGNAHGARRKRRAARAPRPR